MTDTAGEASDDDDAWFNLIDRGQLPVVCEI